MKLDQQNTCRKIALTEYRLCDKPKNFLSRPYVSIFLGASFLVSIPTPSSALTLVANHDAMVDSATPTANYGATASTCISNGGTTQQTFAKFDLAALPKDTVITQATLRIFVNRADADSTLAVNTVDADWTEQTLSQTNAPTLKLLPTPLAIAALDKGSYVNYDITALVKAWQANEPNYGIALTAAGAAKPCNIAIETKESTGTSHPMEIEVAVEGSKGANGKKGVPGSQGPKGDTGETGAQGPAGPQGLAGADGKDGTPGAQGMPGPQGSSGPMGHQGVPGTQGARGTRGADGSMGSNGKSGFNTNWESHLILNTDEYLVRVDARCFPGTKVLNGGCLAVEGKTQIGSMVPFYNNTGYSCYFRNPGPFSPGQYVSAYANCDHVQ